VTSGGNKFNDFPENQMIKFYTVQRLMNDDNSTLSHMMMSRSSRCTFLDTPIGGLIMGCREKFGVSTPQMGGVNNSLVVMLNRR